MCAIPPNGQGIAAQIARGILDVSRANPRFADLSPDCADSVHLAAEAMKIAFRTVREALHFYFEDRRRGSFDRVHTLDFD